MGATPAPQPQPEPEPPPRPDPAKRTRIAYVCLGNSCRSQMAEAWTRYLSRGEVEAVSAGLSPLGAIASETIQVMEEKKVSLAGQESKGLEALDWRLVDVLVNMSSWPVRSIAPSFEGRRLQWEVKDPFGRSLRAHRKVRDQLEKKVQALLDELKSSSGGPAPAPRA